MTTSQCYVTVHDQDLLLACEEAGQFHLVKRPTYLFVGQRPVDRVPGHVDMIVVRDLEPNMEHLPQFYDFTGWWALAKHGLITTDVVVCLQYDMHVLDAAIQRRCERLLATGVDMVAMNAGYFGPNWMLNIGGFEAAYRQALAVKGIEMNDWPKFDAWPSTQGTAWRGEALVDFMLWFEPLFEVLGDNVFAGHLAERTVKAYVETHNGCDYLLGVMQHLAVDCHGTGALMAGNRKLYEERAAVFGLA